MLLKGVSALLAFQWRIHWAFTAPSLFFHTFHYTVLGRGEDLEKFPGGAFMQLEVFPCSLTQVEIGEGVQIYHSLLRGVAHLNLTCSTDSLPFVSSYFDKLVEKKNWHPQKQRTIRKGRIPVNFLL